MQEKKGYLLRIKGIEEGRHELSFKLEQSFFKDLKNEALKNARIDCHLLYEKKGDLIILDFTFKGMVNVACDRCTADIALPIDNSYRMWATFQNQKIAQEQNDVQDQEDWIFLQEKQDNIDLEQYLIDFVVLSAPTQFRYACREEKPFPCDENVLSHIGYFEVNEEEQDSTSSVWEGLKDIDWG